uniref:EB1 C-terminal domain-containing protein n=1 Tax=Globisporangium ultimum (strain ATCC 200006 / CBS 805.95 / DAOM BR144) TaxID=431595 RepID=K3WSI4_GLOUD
MAAADQNIAMMDGTYFVGRKEILDWVNGICFTSLSKVEQTCTGAVACMILDSMYPGKVPMSKVDWSANKDYEYINNYKVLQKCFTNLKIDKHIEVDRLVRGKYQDNLEFMQWFKKFYELNASGQPYDAIAQREKGKGGALYTSKFGGSGGSGSAPSPTPAGAAAAAAARRKPTAAPGAAASRTKPPGAPSSLGSRVGATGAKTATGATRRPVGSAGASAAPAAAAAAVNPQLERELEELTTANESLTNENGELRLAVEGLEKERDFYFGKLRDIEILLQGTEGADTNPLAQNIFKILYATEEEFAAGDVAGEPQDEEM